MGVVGGSDLAKAKEQLGEDYVDIVDWAFPENGLNAFKDGKSIAVQSFKDFLGEEKLKKLINWILKYLSEIDIPVKRGTFIEFRAGMLNVSPIGRNCSQKERDDFEKYDEVHKIRSTMVSKLEAEFADYGLKYSIGVRPPSLPWSLNQHTAYLIPINNIICIYSNQRMTSCA